MQRNIDVPNDPEYRPRISFFDLGKLLIMHHERDLIPEGAEPVLKFRQCPRNFEVTSNTESVSDQPIQTEGVIGIVVGMGQTFNNVDEVGEIDAVTVGKVKVESVLGNVQLAHDNVGPELIVLLDGSRNSGGHALGRDGDIWIVILAVGFCQEPKVQRSKNVHRKTRIRVPETESVIEIHWEEWGHYI